MSMTGGIAHQSGEIAQSFVCPERNIVRMSRMCLDRSILNICNNAQGLPGHTCVHQVGAPWRLGSPARPGKGARASTSARCIWKARASERIRKRLGRRKKGISVAGRNGREALHRSHGGYGTKACVIADSGGRAIAFRITQGHAHELPTACRRCWPSYPACSAGCWLTAPTPATASASTS